MYSTFYNNNICRVKDTQNQITDDRLKEQIFETKKLSHSLDLKRLNFILLYFYD